MLLENGYSLASRLTSDWSREKYSAWSARIFVCLSPSEAMGECRTLNGERSNACDCTCGDRSAAANSFDPQGVLVRVIKFAELFGILIRSVRGTGPQLCILYTISNGPRIYKAERTVVDVRHHRCMTPEGLVAEDLRASIGVI